MPKNNLVSPNEISHNKLMKPLAGMGVGLGLEGPQKVSASTAATGGSNADANQDAGRPAFLFGSYQGFGSMMNAN